MLDSRQAQGVSFNRHSKVSLYHFIPKALKGTSSVESEAKKVAYTENFPITKSEGEVQAAVKMEEAGPMKNQTLNKW